MARSKGMKDKPDYGNTRDEIIRATIERKYEKKIRLKKCCGFEPVIKFQSCTEYFVQCQVCRSKTKYYRHIYEAKQAWNRGERKEA